jgi:hypothetical protein
VVDTAFGLSVEYCGESVELHDGQRLTIGRDADLAIDDNPFLHRVFLVIAQQSGLWFVSNVGSQLSATVSDDQGQMEAFLAPGASLPIVFARTVIAFTAGPTSYEVVVGNATASYQPPTYDESANGDTTLGPTRLTRDQRLMIVALAEPRLRGDGRASVVLPSSSVAARRLGWTNTKFNRKLDNVCDKLTKLGVRGLRGDVAEYASNRRARLVEYAVATRLVTAADLEILDELVSASTVD